MNNIDITAAAAVKGIVLSGICGAAVVRTEIRKHIKEISAARIIKIFRKQAAKAKAEIRSLNRVRGFIGAGKVRREMFDGISLMRNRIAACEGEKITTDVMLEELIADADVLKYPYSRMLSLIRTAERRRAADEFAAIVFMKM